MHNVVHSFTTEVTAYTLLCKLRIIMNVLEGFAYCSRTNKSPPKSTHLLLCLLLPFILHLRDMATASENSENGSEVKREESGMVPVILLLLMKNCYLY